MSVTPEVQRAIREYVYEIAAEQEARMIISGELSYNPITHEIATADKASGAVRDEFTEAWRRFIQQQRGQS